MKKNIKASLDFFKKRTLRCLATKDQAQQIYPITSTDLIHIKKCAVCSSSKTRIVAEVYLKEKLNFFTTCICNNCLFTFRSISPALRWFKKCWKKVKSKEVAVFNPELEVIRKKRYQEYYRLLSKYVRAGKVLDIGAGFGAGSSVFRDHGYEVEALEPDDNKAQYIRKALNMPLYQASIESFLATVPRKRYDLIIFAHCLEHLDMPATTFAQLKKLLKPSGVLYVEVPVLWNYVTWSDALYLTYKSNFGEEHLTRFIKNHGFNVKEKKYMRHSSKEPWDFGLVLKMEATSLPKSIDPKMPKNRSIDTVQKLYHKNLPMTGFPASTEKIVYSVPLIDQFYCTLRFENYLLTKSRMASNILTFTPKSP